MAEIKITRQEIISLCRLCLGKDLVSIDIFEAGSELRHLYTKIVACLPVQVFATDTLPHKICEVCNAKVDDFYQFWTCTAKNQKQLNDWLQIATDQITDAPTIKVEAEDTSKNDEFDDYDDGARGDDSEDEDEEASVPKRIKTQHSDDEDTKPTELISSMVDESSEISDQKEGNRKRSKEIQYENCLIGVLTRGEWEILRRDKVRKCPKCNKHFYSPNTMRRHLIETHVDNKSFPCDKCDKIFVSRTKVERHMKTIHENIIRRTDVKQLECYYCGATRSSKTLMRDHICAHLGLKMHHCNTCGCDFSSKKSLKRHKDIHVKTIYKPFVEDHQIEDISPEEYKKLVKEKVQNCPKCFKQFSTPRYMRKHLREVHSTQKCRVCDVCGNQYKSKSSLSEHKKYMHTEKCRKKKNPADFVCDICGIPHANKYTLQDHMNTHTGNKYTCDVCGSAYSSLKHLRRHKVKHLKENGLLPESMTHRCQLCDKVFTQNHALKKHLEWVHGNKCHVCKICGAKIKGNLQQHMITHTGEKKFCCHICGKKLRGKLKEHMLVHTGERPYACEFCGSTFKDKWYLRIHMRKHNGERPYMCNECGQSFAARSAFTLHLKKHSNLSQCVECEFCRESFTSKLKLKEHLKMHF